MENTENWKHINFELWCPSCIHQDEEESDPYLKCHDCLEGARINSQKPVNYKKKERDRVDKLQSL